MRWKDWSKSPESCGKVQVEEVRGFCVALVKTLQLFLLSGLVRDFTAERKIKPRHP